MNTRGFVCVVTCLAVLCASEAVPLGPIVKDSPSSTSKLEEVSTASAASHLISNQKFVLQSGHDNDSSVDETAKHAPAGAEPHKPELERTSGEKTENAAENSSAIPQQEHERAVPDSSTRIADKEDVKESKKSDKAQDVKVEASGETEKHEVTSPKTDVSTQPHSSESKEISGNETENAAKNSSTTPQQNSTVPNSSTPIPNQESSKSSQQADDGTSRSYSYILHWTVAVCIVGVAIFIFRHKLSRPSINFLGSATGRSDPNERTRLSNPADDYSSFQLSDWRTDNDDNGLLFFCNQGSTTSLYLSLLKEKLYRQNSAVNNMQDTPNAVEEF